MRTDDLDFYLPPELIAQTPSPQRAASRLLHYQKSTGTIEHRTFSDLPRLLRPDDVLVFNDARVIPARFMLRKSTGGRIEGLFLREVRPNRWYVLLRDAKGAGSAPMYFDQDPNVAANIVRFGPGGEYEIDVQTDEPAIVLLSRVGRMPLPPYIRRERDHDARDDADRERYQTVYAKTAGSVAAPTAGLHFTDSILAELETKGVQRIFLTLHVGLGTFKPVTVDKLEAHTMHTESYSVDAATAEALNRAQRDGRRIVAVGTTAARVLESWPKDEPWRETAGETSIFIYPPHEWKRVGALVTNFHLPRSTLIALVAAFVGLEQQRRLYRVAIEEQYRFFSYGDAMFLE